MLENVKEKKKSAKELFEELGYEYNYYPGSHYINFFKDTDEENHMTYNKITFHIRLKKIDILGLLDAKELQAINKQVKELGWC